MYLFGLGRGDMLSASTIGMIGHGKKALTAGLQAGFAASLDIPAHDLTTVTGIDLDDDPASHHPDSAATARLIWDARRLTAGQLHQVEGRAHTIRHERADDLEAGMRCSCQHQEVRACRSLTCCLDVGRDADALCGGEAVEVVEGGQVVRAGRDGVSGLG